MAYGYGNGSGNYLSVTAVGANIPANTWTHVAMVKNSTNVIFYYSNQVEVEVISDNSIATNNNVLRYSKSP